MSDQVIFNPQTYCFGDNFDKNKYDYYAGIILDARQQTTLKPSLLEIGGGNGWLGRALLRNDIISEYRNIDPTCNEDQHNIGDYFHPKFNWLAPDIILVSNVLGNINNPKTLVDSLISTYPHARFIFSVQDSHGVFSKGLGELLFHEHKTYFDAPSFKKLFDKANGWHFYYSNLHHRSLLATNFEMLRDKQDFKNNSITPDLIFHSEKQYKERIASLISKIDKAGKPIIGVGCGPRSIRMIYDIVRERPSSLIHIEEPDSSLKIGHHLPEIMIPILPETAEVNLEFGYLWLPMHVKIPQKYKLVHI